MGYFNFLYTFFVLLLADVCPDIFYYYLGRYGNKKILESKYFKNSKKIPINLNKLESMWRNHTRKTMFLGKLAYGISVPIIISAGMAKLPFKKFISTSLPFGVLQTLALLLVGYNLSVSYKVAGQYVKYPGIIIAIMLILALILYATGKTFSTKLLRKTI